MGVYGRLLEMTSELLREGQKRLVRSVRFGEPIARITDKYQARCSFQAGHRHRSWPVLRMVSGPAV